MLDMLFVTSSHTLSPYIYSLDSRCKQLSDKERAEVKEKIDPNARFVLENLNASGVIFFFLKLVGYHMFQL